MMEIIIVAQIILLPCYGLFWLSIRNERLKMKRQYDILMEDRKRKLYLRRFR